MPQELIRFFIIDGVEYGINPDFNDQTFGEMTDCRTDDVVTQMAILYRPIVSKKNNNYTIKEYEADITSYEKIKSQLTADYYIGFVSFFLRIHESFVIYTQKCLTVQASHQKKKPNSEKNGVGFLGSTNLLEVI